MKLLGTRLCSFDYPPLDGGIARLCSELARGLAGRGLPLAVLTQRPAGDRVSDETAPAIPEERVTSLRPVRELAALRRLRLSRDAGPVIAGIWYPEGLLAALAGSRPLVILAHGSELLPTRSRLRRGLWRRLLRWTLGRADLVVANSSYTKTLAERAAPGCRVVALPLAVDHRRFAPGGRDAAREKFGARGKRALLSVSRLRRYKGHDTVLRAMAGLPEDLRSEFVYLVAGKGPDRAWLETEAQRLGVGDLVRFLGYVAEEELPDLYRSADLFILCTRESESRQEVEGFGLVFLEAQACGTPVVGARTGGIPDAIREDEGGWLVGQDNHAALAAILERLAREPAAFDEAGRAARARVERECTWDGYVERFASVLAERGISLG